MTTDVEVVNFGCRLNAAEAERVRALAAPCAARPTIVLNTCAVTAAAERDARRMARKPTTRNRMRRIAREVFRQHEARDTGQDLIVLPRAAYGRAGARAWAGVVRSLLDRVTAKKK